MRIPEDKVELIRVSVDIVDVVGDYVQLKKRGSNFVGLCPFHNEKTPSFNVNPNMQIYKCFGCGVGGDVYQFVIGMEGLSFPEAARQLAERAGIALPEDERDNEAANEVESIYQALRFAGRFFYKQLTQTDAGRPALDYLAEQRGFEAATIKRFGLGYAPDAWDRLLTAAEEQHITAETLEKAGLVIPRKDGSGYYDRYRGRVIFPIFSHVGKVLGFGGRILTDAKDQPKYINSPETKVYHKSQVLYGLYQGKQAIRKQEEVILVEGYTDVVSLHQAGVEHVVASSGTALTEEQVKTLSRYAKRVLLLYDADAAGATAALRGIDLVLAQGLGAYAVGLPEGDDPDTYVQEHGGEAFVEYVAKHRMNFLQFMVDRARADGAFDTPEGTAETRHRIVATLAKISDALLRDAYIREAAEVLGLYERDLRAALEQAMDDQARSRRRSEERAARRAHVPPPPPDAMPFDVYEDEEAAGMEPVYDEPPEALREPLPEEKVLLRLMLEHGRLMVEYILGNMALDEFTPGPARQAMDRLVELYNDDAVNARKFLDGTFGPALQSLAAEVLMDVHEPSENWQRKQNINVPRLNEEPYESAASAMVYLKLDRVDEALEALRGRIFRASQQGADLSELQREMMALHQLRKQIEQRAFLEWDDAGE